MQKKWFKFIFWKTGRRSSRNIQWWESKNKYRLYTVRDYDSSWGSQYSLFLNLTTTVLDEGFFGHVSTMMRDKNGNLKGTNFAIDVQILKSNYGTPMALQNKYIFYQFVYIFSVRSWNRNFQLQDYCSLGKFQTFLIRISIIHFIF